MLYGVIADIHGNLEAFQTVLEEIGKADIDCLICAGDVVGYAAHPSKCIEIVRNRADAVVAGNHDWAVAGKLDTSYFNSDARDAVDWTRSQLSENEISWLADLPLTVQVDGVSLVHSTLYNPEYFDYIQTLYQAELCFSRQETPMSFVGHSHVPVIFRDGQPVEYFLREEFEMGDEDRCIVNVGSVGQPRDSDPRASYVLYNSDKREVEMRRISYDVSATMEAILEANLPITNAHRLRYGR